MVDYRIGISVQSRRDDETPVSDTELISWLTEAGHAAARHRRMYALSTGAGFGPYLAIAIRLRDKVREIGPARTAALAWSIVRARLKRATS